MLACGQPGPDPQHHIWFLEHHQMSPSKRKKEGGRKGERRGKGRKGERRREKKGRRGEMGRRTAEEQQGYISFD